MTAEMVITSRKNRGKCPKKWGEVSLKRGEVSLKRGEVSYRFTRELLVKEPL